MPTAFGAPANNIVAMVGAAGYVAGSGTLVLAAGQGAGFPALTGNGFYRITVVQQSHAYDPLMTVANYTIFKATSLATDTFSGVTVIEGTTDRNYVGGDVVDVRVTRGTLSDIQTAVNNAETNTSQLNAAISRGRLTLTSGDASGVTPATGTTLYFTPYRGNLIALYDGTATWNLLAFSEISKTIPTTTGVYDVFAFNNAGTLDLAFSNGWAATGNNTAAAGTRTDALVLQDGIHVKSGATTRRYLGTIYSAGGTASDTLTLRGVWNYANRLRRKLFTFQTAASWIYGTATWRAANGNASNQSQIQLVVGLQEDLNQFQVGAEFQAGSGSLVSVAIGYDASTSPSGTDVAQQFASGTIQFGIIATSYALTHIGLHTYYWIELVQSVNSTFLGGGFGSYGTGFLGLIQS